jgi:hypothetical protein
MIHESLISGPEWLQFALMFAVFLVLPGMLAVELAFGRSLLDRFAKAPLSLGLGVTMISVWCLAAYFAGAGARTAMVVSLAATGLMAIALVFRRFRRGPGRAALEREASDAALARGREGRTMRWVLCVLLAAVFTLVVARGAVFSWQTDSLDHVGTIREIGETDKIFPTNSFYAGEEGLGADPRKGLFHTAVAIVSIASGLEPYKVWIWLPGLLLPLLLLGFFVFCRELFDSNKTALVASVLFVLCIEALGRYVLRAAGYPAQVAWLLYLVALTMMFRHVRSSDWRDLAAAALLGGATGTVHIYYFFQFGLALIVFLLFAVLMRRYDRALIATIIKTGILSAVVALPFLVVKYRLSYAVNNPFDEQLRWVLFLSDSWYVVNPVEPWKLVGPMAVLALLITPFLWGRAKRDARMLFVFATMVATPLIIYNPLLVPPLGDFLTTGLVRRIVFLAPYVAVLGYVTSRMLDDVTGGAGLRQRIRAGLFLAVMVVLLVPYAVRLQQTFSADAMDRERKQSAFVWYDALEYLETREAGVVLSDPWTSYSVPTFTRHYIVAVPIGHASPKDARNVHRVRDAMDVLNPYVDIDATCELLDRYRVDYVVLNETYTRPIVAYGWALDPQEYAARRGKFDAHPGLFRFVYDEGGVVIYRYDREGAASGVEGPDLPFVSKYVPALEGAVDAVFEDQFTLIGAVTDRETVKRGGVVRVRCYWQKTGEERTPAYYRVFTRFDTNYDKNALYQPSWSKLYRYGLQKLRGVRYRFRFDHNPVGSLYPPYRWTPGEVIVDEYPVRVPLDVAPGTYDVKIRMRAMPFSPNYHLRDFLRDDDVYSGVRVASIQITG